MELKRRVRQAIELAVIVSALPVLLLGCGGGGATSTDPNAGRVYGQFWTDITSADGLRGFSSGSLYLPPRGDITTASFSGGNYYWNTVSGFELVGGVWRAVSQNPTLYFLSASGWSLYPDSLQVTAVDDSHFSFHHPLWGSVQAAISTINLAGTPIVASSAVPAVDSNGVASQVSPSGAVYPAGAYQFDIASTYTQTSEAFVMVETADYLVTTISSSTAPIDQAHFNAATFSAHSNISDPICTGFGYAFVYSGVGATYKMYLLTLNSGLATTTPKTCQNSSITTAYSTPYELSFSAVNGETIATFVASTGGKLIMSFSPANGKPYVGLSFPAGTTSSVDSVLNKTAMDAALAAWGVPTF